MSCLFKELCKNTLAQLLSLTMAGKTPNNTIVIVEHLLHTLFKSYSLPGILITVVSMDQLVKQWE